MPEIHQRLIASNAYLIVTDSTIPSYDVLCPRFESRWWCHPVLYGISESMLGTYYCRYQSCGGLVYLVAASRQNLDTLYHDTYPELPYPYHTLIACQVCFVNTTFRSPYHQYRKVWYGGMVPYLLWYLPHLLLMQDFDNLRE